MSAAHGATPSPAAAPAAPPPPPAAAAPTPSASSQSGRKHWWENISFPTDIAISMGTLLFGHWLNNQEIKKAQRGEPHGTLFSESYKRNKTPALKFDEAHQAKFYSEWLKLDDNDKASMLHRMTTMMSDDQLPAFCLSILELKAGERQQALRRFANIPQDDLFQLEATKIFVGYNANEQMYPGYWVDLFLTQRVFPLLQGLIVPAPPTAPTAQGAQAPAAAPAVVPPQGTIHQRAEVYFRESLTVRNRGFFGHLFGF